MSPKSIFAKPGQQSKPPPKIFQENVRVKQRLEKERGRARSPVRRGDKLSGGIPFLIIRNEVKSCVQCDQLILFILTTDNIDSTVGLPNRTRLRQRDACHVGQENSIDHIVSNHNNRLTQVHFE